MTPSIPSAEHIHGRLHRVSIIPATNRSTGTDNPKSWCSYCKAERLTPPNRNATTPALRGKRHKGRNGGY